MESYAVVAVIFYGDKLLLGKKRSDSKKFLAGKWHIPGETVEEGETDEMALIRGMKEETALDIRIGKFIGSHLTPTHKLAKWYECFSETDKTIHGGDLEEICWVKVDNVLEVCGPEIYRHWSQEILDYFGKYKTT